MSSSTTGSRKGPRTTPPRPRPFRLEILPESRVLNAPANTQQVVVLVRGADKTVRDVTPICYYDSSNPEIAEVDADGYVRFKARGEVAIIAHYLNLVANVRLTHLVEVPGFVQAAVPQDNLIDRAVFAKLNRMRICSVRAVHRPRVHPPHLPRRPGRSCPRRMKCGRSWRIPPPLAATTSSTGSSSVPSFTTSGP